MAKQKLHNMKKNFKLTAIKKGRASIAKVAARKALIEKTAVGASNENRSSIDGIVEEEIVDAMKGENAEVFDEEDVEVMIQAVYERKKKRLLAIKVRQLSALGAFKKAGKRHGAAAVIVPLDSSDDDGFEKIPEEDEEEAAADGIEGIQEVEEGEEEG